MSIIEKILREKLLLTVLSFVDARCEDRRMERERE
jgi:hypothetical protein